VIPHLLPTSKEAAEQLAMEYLGG
ncbi:TetR family transcriptional regulator, partial [Pseudomonas syringae pv. actinidiae]|nr:TetR family transcriptional regulator [Pseudomonas syringae pv. actinidiae]